MGFTSSGPLLTISVRILSVNGEGQLAGSVSCLSSAGVAGGASDMVGLGGAWWG